MADLALRSPHTQNRLSGGVTAIAVTGAALFAAGSVTLVPNSPLLPFILLAGAALLAAAIAHPMWLVTAGVLAIPLEGLGDFFIGPAQALMGIAATGWLIRTAIRRPLTLPRHPALAAFALLMVANVAGLIFAPLPGDVVKQLVTWGTMFVVALCIAQTESTPQVRRLLFAFAAAGAIVAFLTIVLPQPITGDTGQRATAGFGSPNVLGTLLAMALPAQLIFALRGRSPAERLASQGFVGITLIAMTLAVSRGAFLGLAAAALVLVFWAPLRNAALVGLPVLIALGILAGNPVASVVDTGVVADRLTRIGDDEASVQRTRLWQDTPAIIRDNPVFGVGAFQFPSAADEYRLSGTTGPPPHAHNIVLTIAAELGLIGLGAFLAMLGFVAVALRRVIARGSAEEQALAFALASALVVLFVAGIVDYVVAAPVAVAMFSLVACSVALALGTKQRAPAPAPLGRRAPARSAGLAPG